MRDSIHAVRASFAIHSGDRHFSPGFVIPGEIIVNGSEILSHGSGGTEEMLGTIWALLR